MMTIPFPKGRLTVRLARTDGDVLACQRLRYRCFKGGEGVDRDRYDDRCTHLMVADETGQLVATARYQLFGSGADIHRSYAAQHYDLGGLGSVAAPMIEIGRFCVAPQVLDLDVLRATWAALTRIVDDAGVRFLFGCSSFSGTDPAQYSAAFRHLASRHLGPDDLRPTAIGQDVVPLASVPPQGADPMPHLLRSYLAMGGWVGAEATIDHDLQTMHIFTCVDVETVPAARAKALRALAEGTDLS